MADKDDRPHSGDYDDATKYRRAIAMALLKQKFGQHGAAGGIGVADKDDRPHSGDYDDATKYRRAIAMALLKQKFALR